MKAKGEEEGKEGSKGSTEAEETAQRFIVDRHQRERFIGC